MFICSVKASSIKFFSLILLCLIGLVGAVAIGAEESVAVVADGTVRFDGIKTDSDRRAFIESFGYVVEGNAVEEVSFSVPRDFDKVISGYNEIQKAQGLDLGRYHGKKVTRYTYKIANYRGFEGTVYANLIVYRSRIIACDVSSADPSGFVKPLTVNE